MRTAACLCRALGVHSTRPGPRVGRQHAARKTQAPEAAPASTQGPYAPVGAGPGQNLPPEQAESVRGGGGRLKPEDPGLPGGRVGREGDSRPEGQLQGLWPVCLPSETGNKVTVSAPGGSGSARARDLPSHFCWRDTTLRLRFSFQLTGIWASLSPQQVNRHP